MGVASGKRTAIEKALKTDAIYRQLSAEGKLCKQSRDEGHGDPASAAVIAWSITAGQLTQRIKRLRNVVACITMYALPVTQLIWLPTSTGGPIKRTLKTFLTTPTPKDVGQVQCFVVKTKYRPEFRLYMEQDERFLLAARRKINNEFVITMHQGKLTGAAAEKKALGKISRSNIWGAEFRVYDNGVCPRSTQSVDPTRIRKELCGISFGKKKDVLNQTTKVALPQVSETERCVMSQPEEAAGGLLERAKNNDKDCLILIPKTPVWNDVFRMYVLNFHGRATMASMRNVQLVHPDDHDTVIMQIGMVQPYKYTVDYQFPMSPIQAFSIFVSTHEHRRDKR